MPESAIKRYLPYTDRKGADVSIADYDKIPNRFLSTSVSKESQFERPYLGPGYRLMNLAPPLTVAAPPIQAPVFNMLNFLPWKFSSLTPWEFSPWTPWPPWPKIESPDLPPTPWTPPRIGSTRWLRYTRIGFPPECSISLFPNSGGCVGSGEEFSVRVDFLGLFVTRGGVNITSRGEGEVTIGQPETEGISQRATGVMGETAGVSIICATYQASYIALYSFEYQKNSSLVFGSVGTIRVHSKHTGTLDVVPHELWRNHSIQKAKVTLDCGCDEFENCDADECVACNYTIDEGTTPQTIGADDNVTVTFIPAGDCLESSTFSWSIEYPGTPSQYGKGFSVDAATTGSPSVGITTVSGDGVAFVVMEDECGNTAKYELRCTAGNWKLCVNNLTGTCTDSEYCDPTDYLVVTIDLHETGAAGENHWSQIYSECRNCEYPACRGGSPECESRTCSAPWFTKVVGCACDYLLRKLWYWGR